MLIRTLIAATLALGLCVGASAQEGRELASGQPEPSLQDRVDALAQQIYRRYQHYPPALASQRAAAEKVLSVWNQIAPNGEEKASPENLDRMADWLDAAIRAVMPGGSGEFPAAPDFERRQPEAPRFEEPGEPAEVVPADKSSPSTGAGVVDPTATTSPVRDAAGPKTTSVVEPERSRLKVSDPVATINNPYVNDAEPTRARPETSVNPLRRSPRDAEPTPSQFAGPRATAKPVVPEPEAFGSDSNAPQRSKWSQHPSAAPLEWRDPFADDPSASPNPLRSGSRHETRRPEYRQSYRSRSSKVNLRQLSADIRGYNSALRSLQSAVMGLKQSDIAALAAAEEELNRLDERRQFLDLYRAGLTPAQQRVLPDSPSAEVVRELVRRKSEALSDHSSSSLRDERRAQQADWFDGF
ncbi:hypothetical protein [Botrimarina mediterranea]|uniref:Uncharacterized protein n=1 Tax=Botrimarina mediterranea TaxID=2528022 RepID=A0A518KEY6_9BACT|nr:hypothetical protein [Botrimarina mediterranea]QDV76357.1 hypothetical protein Spa11_45870 [Botrimarina mediterranea]QDV80955.1 hypothetical protein K2D_45900 [Planctomycetes bacterium K2D]